VVNADCSSEKKNFAFTVLLASFEEKGSRSIIPPNAALTASTYGEGVNQLPAFL